VRRARLVKRLFAPLNWLAGRLSLIRLPASISRFNSKRPRLQKVGDAVWIAIVLAATAFALWLVVNYIRANLGLDDVVGAFGLGCLTLVRVVVLIAIASLVWVPIGVWIGLRPAVAERVQPVAQFLAAFPANVLFPIAVVVIVSLRLDPNIWLSPLMVLGTQWYILFNVIAGASAFPTDLREASTVFRLRSWQWWREAILPGIFPYYVTGALTASGGSWNASIVAEVASWGDTRLHATGLGAYIAEATEHGDYPRVVLGIAVMSIFVVTINRMLWRPLYRLAERRFRLD
jgi:NitT/TauT family transport system permease protein